MLVVLFQSGHTEAIMACCLLGCPVAHKEQETHKINLEPIFMTLIQFGSTGLFNMFIILS